MSFAETDELVPSLLRVFRTSSVNVGCRAATMGSKFLAMIFLTRFLAPSAIGIYGLFVATISYVIFALGMEFYTYNTREILKRARNEAAFCVRDQFAFQAVVYLVAAPFLSLLFVYCYLPVGYIGWFFSLLILEHLNREVYRILVITMQPVKGTILLLVGTGLWPWAVIPVMMLYPRFRDLRFVWIGWTAGDMVALLLAAFWLRNLGWQKTLVTPVDWHWIRKGMNISLVLLGASLSLAAITTLDRYAIRHYLGDGMVGIYVFYATVAYAVYSFMESGIISVQYPKIVQAYQCGNIGEYRKNVKMLAVGIIGGGSALCAISALGIRFVLRFLNKQIYADHIHVYWVLLAMISVWLLSLVPHYALYARRMDKYIAISNLMGLAVSVLAFSIFIPWWGITGCALATLSGMTLILVLKYCFLARSGQTHSREAGLLQ